MPTKRILITGGAGFIGCNAARYFGARNWNVTVLDNLSRARDRQEPRSGCAKARPSTSSKSMCAIGRPIDRVLADGRFDAVIHLAAQVAVTTSVADPRTDFAVNAFGTFNVLDAVRLHCPDAVLHLCVDQQGLRQDRRSQHPSCAAIAMPTSTDRTASAKASRLTFSRPTAARRERPISTRSISRGSTRSPPRRSASRASTGRASSAWRIRAGLPGS